MPVLGGFNQRLVAQALKSLVIDRDTGDAQTLLQRRGGDGVNRSCA
jgi:hypothetical protein